MTLVEFTGPFLTVPVLERIWPAGLDSLDLEARGRLREQHAQWMRDPHGRHHEWITFVVREFLEWGDRVRVTGEAWTGLSLHVAEHDEDVRADFGLVDADGESLRLLGVVCPPETKLHSRPKGSAWSASWPDRLARLLRRHRIPLGLLTSGRWWCLVYAPIGEPMVQVGFDATIWTEELDVARAFYSLLRAWRFFGVPEDETLPALLACCRDQPQELTEALGLQARKAVELLVHAYGRADAEYGSRLIHDADEAYTGAVTVLLRLLFVLFAEERELLDLGSPAYADGYSMSSLADELRRRATDEGEEVLERSTAAWCRMLALARALHWGVDTEEISVPAYDGGLFDPDGFPWLEGLPDADVLRIDDRTMLHVLEALQYVEIGGEKRRVSFSALAVEEIGYVYERLLGNSACRAVETAVGLVGRYGREETVPLAVLEEHARQARGDLGELARRLHEAYGASGIGTVSALTRCLAPLGEKEQAEARRRLLAVTDGDWELTERLLPFYRIIRTDLRDLPLVILPGGLYVTRGARAVGTHYTPKELVQEIVESALEPLVYSPGPLQTADRSQWMPKSSAEILDLKIVDVAVGSGPFLVAACRYLAERLVEAWTAEGTEVPPQRTPVIADRRGDHLLARAKYLVLTQCLYGVDVDRIAVQMTRLSLWLLEPTTPFAFLDDRIVEGDSLLGITSLDQVEWMHVRPERGRTLHEGKPWAFTKGLRGQAEKAVILRRDLRDLPPTDLESLYGKRRLCDEAKEAVRQVGQFADLVVGAALVGAKQGSRAVDRQSLRAADLARLLVENPGTEPPEIERWLATDAPDHRPRPRLHWPLEFPEVFLDRGGFDAVVGNPPFLGGQKLTGALGEAYRGYLVEGVAEGRRGSADLAAYFLLRAHELLHVDGQIGLIATNTLAQGDTREVGLDRLVASGAEIRRAVKSRKWPGKAALEYCAVWVSKAPLGKAAERVLDGQVVRGITSSLDPRARVSGIAHRLTANEGIAFIGSYVLGLGFTMAPGRAEELIVADPRNREVLFPYLNGEDLNSSPTCSAGRWVINFHDWPEEQAKTYAACYSKVARDVRPQRMAQKDRHGQKYWWRFLRPRPELHRAIAGLDRVIVLTLVSKTVMPVMVPTGQVFAHKLGVFATDDMAMLALLSSAPHYWWAWSRSSTMKADLNYSPSDVFETFARPEPTQEMRELGERLHAFRGELMRSRNLGLTKTYNLVHDPGCVEEGIAELREIHRRIDQAVCRAYGWDDLELDHSFYETRQGVRYTVGPAVRQEILDRLLELNHQRYAEEAVSKIPRQEALFEAQQPVGHDKATTRERFRGGA